MTTSDYSDVSAHRTRTNERRRVEHPNAQLVQAVEDVYDALEDRQ